MECSELRPCLYGSRGAGWALVSAGVEGGGEKNRPPPVRKYSHRRLIRVWHKKQKLKALKKLKINTMERIYREPFARFFIGAAIQAGTKMLGSAMAMIGAKVNGDKMDKVTQGVEARKNELESEYRELENGGPTAAEVNASRQMQKQAEASAKAAKDNAIRGGSGSAEAAIGTATALQESNAGAMADMAAASTARKDALRQSRIQQVGALDDQITQQKMSRIQQSQEAFSSLAG